MRRVFFAATVETAVASARRELGGEALLIDVQPAPSEGGGPGGYQVLFETSCDRGGNDVREEAAIEPRSLTEAGAGLGDVKAELARLSSLVACLASAGTGCPGRPELTRMAAMLQSYDLPAEWAQPILSRAALRLGSEDRGSAIRRIVAEELRMGVSFDVGVDPGNGRRVVALVGPPGAGKTTMLVKLAMRLGVSARRPALVLTTDTYRVAAADQLRTYAGVLGLPFQLVESPGGLASALMEHRQKELILIDTPGFSPRDWESAREWADMIEANPEVCVQLVLPATMRASDMRAVVRRWAIFRPDQLIFTRMDETSAYGGCVAAALESRKPLSWVSTGQDIPEDLEPASPDRIFGALPMHEFNAMAVGA